MFEARQYGKTTTLSLLEITLSEKYTVFFITFEGAGDLAFRNENTFCRFVCRLLYNAMRYGTANNIPEKLTEKCHRLGQKDSKTNLLDLSDFISELCGTLNQPSVLMIDEVDQAGNQEIFLSFQ